jgi:hypothetical protein
MCYIVYISLKFLQQNPINKSGSWLEVWAREYGGYENIFIDSPKYFQD